ncbi:hypothetical protein BT96DRAFT_850041, partial [Gymnopus androsaceus JB14]
MGIVERMKNGTRPNTNYMYNGHQHMVTRIQQMDRQLNTLKLRITNDSRLLHGRAVALDDHKRLLRVFRDGKLENLDRFLRVGMKRGLGVKGLISLYERAEAGLYHPKSYEKEDYLRGIVYWRMGGVRMAEFAHRANGMPGISTIRANSTVATIIPSPATPLLSEIVSNAKTVLEVDVIASPEETTIHQVFMLDEIATEQRIRYDDQTNHFLGVCREHAGNVTLEFNDVDDVEQLYKSLDDGDVHHATEATIGAIGILSGNKRLYNARPILVSGTCKRETGLQQAKVIKTGLDALNSLQPRICLRTVSIASDGEAKRGKAFETLTFKHELTPESNIYPLLSPLKYLNLLVGDDDLTCDKDFRHILKRTRDLLLRARGMNILDVHITPSILKSHLREAGHTDVHIESLFKPSDKQDVPTAYQLLRDLWALPSSSSTSPRVQAERKAIKLIGTLFYEYLVLPYISVELSLSEQLQHLSSAAFLSLVLYRCSGKDFIPTLLYQDIQILIKNALFCVAKGKIDIPNGLFWLALLGTDRLEQLFGILRSIIGNDCNVDILQLVHRLTGTTELSNILAEHPEWDRTPRRLRLPAVDRQGKEILGSSIDHVSPATWKGDVRTSVVSLLNCWKVARSRVETVFPDLKPLFASLDTESRSVDTLRPKGELLIGRRLPSDDNEDDDADPVALATGTESATSSKTFDVFGENSGIRDLEDTIAEEVAESTSESVNKFTTKILDNGKLINKSRFLSQFVRKRKYDPSSTDRLRRVQQMSRFSTDKANGSSSVIIDNSAVYGDQLLLLSEPVASILSCEGQLFLCIGDITGIQMGRTSVEQIDTDTLLEEGVTVEFQLTHLEPATSDDDPSSENDWCSSYNSDLTPALFTVPGHLVQAVNPVISVPVNRAQKTSYLFESAVLVALAQELLHRLAAFDGSRTLKIPHIKRSSHFPYLTTKGEAAFLCEHDGVGRNDVNGGVLCSSCINPSVQLDISKPQSILTHMGAHILHGTTPRSTEPCGFCLSPFPQCLFYLTRTNQISSSSRGCLVFKSIGKISYAAAAKSTQANPCSNVPIRCPVCTQIDPNSPAIWRYNAEEHFKIRHPNINRASYMNL